MISRSDLRKANISVAVGMAVLVIGMLLFEDAGEGAIQLVGLAMLIATFGTLTFLLERDDSRRKREERDQ